MKKIKFEDIILQNACNYINNVIEIFKKLLEEEMDITELSLKVREIVDKLGIETMIAITEELDKIIKEDKRRKEKWVVEREDEKTLITTVGEIKYKRTYYKSKEDGRYTYLTDDALGISRNPLGWSREGLKLMAKLRVFSKNGGDLSEIEWGKRENINAGSYKLTKKQIKDAVKRVKTSTNEKINNITVLNIGKVTPIYRVLRALKYAQVI